MDGSGVDAATVRVGLSGDEEELIYLE